RIIPLVIEERKLLAVKKKISELQAYQTGSDITKNDSCENDNNCKNDNNCENDINYGQNAGNTDIKIRPFYNVLPFKHKKAAIIATGSEVKKGLIKDTFTPVIEAKLAEYDTEIVYKALPGDEHEKITEEIMKAVKEYDADIVLCTGGMSVDPDDRTPLAIRNTGARIVCYGAPVLPGAMFMLGYYEPVDEESCDNRGKDTVVRNEEGYRTGAAPNEESCGCRGIDTAVRKKVAVMGLPGCVMFHGRTVFDLVLPRIMADDEVFPEEIAALGTGGLCLNCGTCTFPNCGFGK
ncbi:MAG: hypothetical protein J5824_08875, partial [Lachnospiraceae bacterium]|nr:hypothetical protein [Lachnospiraceae bacterium]